MEPEGDDDGLDKRDDNKEEEDDDQMSCAGFCNFCDFSSQSYAECEEHAHRCVGAEILAKRKRKYCNYCSLFDVSKTEAYKEGDYKVEEDCYNCGTNSSSGDEESTNTSGDDDKGKGSNTKSKNNVNHDNDDSNNNNNNKPYPNTVEYNNKTYTLGEYLDLQEAKRTGRFRSKETGESKEGYVFRTSGKYGEGYYRVDTVSDLTQHEINEINNMNNMAKEVVLFEFHGNTIKPPKNGDIFQPLEVAELITSLSVKGTSKRAELIQLILQKKLVRGKSKLYETIKKYEEGTEFKLTWNERGAPKKNTITTARFTEAINARPKGKPANMIRVVPFKSINKTIREQIRCDIGEDICSAGKHIDSKGWRGELYLDVTPVTFADINQYSSYEYSNGTRLVNKMVDLTEPITLDICTFLGQRNRAYAEDTDEWITFPSPVNTFCRLYFNQKEFPPPNDLKEGGNNETFTKLKNYIMVSSTSSKNPRLTPQYFRDLNKRCTLDGRSNSAVVCSGGSNKYQNKVFRCAHAYKNVQGTKQSCPMSFTVCWDRYGYYINLMTKVKQKRQVGGKIKLFHGTNATGCPWHCCGSHELLYRCNICYEVQLDSESLLEHKKKCKPKGSRVQCLNGTFCDGTIIPKFRYHNV